MFSKNPGMKKPCSPVEKSLSYKTVLDRSQNLSTASSKRGWTESHGDQDSWHLGMWVSHMWSLGPRIAYQKVVEQSEKGHSATGKGFIRCMPTFFFGTYSQTITPTDSTNSHWFCVVKWNLPHVSAGSWHFGVSFILRHFLTWPTVNHSWVNEAWMRHHRPGSSYNTYFIIVEAFNYWKRWTIDEFCIWDSLPA